MSEQIVRRLFYASVACLCLAGSVGLGFGLAGAGQREPVASEVVVASGWVQNGGTIPLPTYEDGTVASEDECHWMVSPRWMQLHGRAEIDVSYELNCYTEDGSRMVVCYGRRNNPGWEETWPGRASYLIVAVRAVEGPTPTTSMSWGSVKSGFARQAPQ